MSGFNKNNTGHTKGYPLFLGDDLGIIDTINDFEVDACGGGSTALLLQISLPLMVFNGNEYVAQGCAKKRTTTTTITDTQ